MFSMAQAMESLSFNVSGSEPCESDGHVEWKSRKEGGLYSRVGIADRETAIDRRIGFCRLTNDATVKVVKIGARRADVLAIVDVLAVGQP